MANYYFFYAYNMSQYVVGEVDILDIKRQKYDEEDYEYVFIPKKIIAETEHREHQEISMTPSHHRDWIFRTLEEAERACILMIFI